MKEIQNCPICGNINLKNKLKVADHFGSKEAFDLLSCEKCQTLLTSPVPDENEIITYYKSNSYVSHGESVNPIFDKTYKYIQSRNLKYKQRLIEKYTLGKRLLDYGCGAGSFLAHMNEKGWSTIGVEPDDKARQLAINKGLNITDLNSINSTFDIITLFHVLEHVHSLNDTLEKIISLLDKNGVLMLALPNHQSLDATHYQEYWAGYDVPRHLYHFSQKSIFTLSKKFGLNIVATHPLYFDSYYVSLLSEKYMDSGNQILKAIKMGYRSNRKATKTKEYSSLIYVISK